MFSPQKLRKGRTFSPLSCQFGERAKIYVFFLNAFEWRKPVIQMSTREKRFVHPGGNEEIPTRARSLRPERSLVNKKLIFYVAKSGK